ADVRDSTRPQSFANKFEDVALVLLRDPAVHAVDDNNINFVGTDILVCRNRSKGRFVERAVVERCLGCEIARTLHMCRVEVAAPYFGVEIRGRDGTSRESVARSELGPHEGLRTVERWLAQHHEPHREPSRAELRRVRLDIWRVDDVSITPVGR